MKSRTLLIVIGALVLMGCAGLACVGLLSVSAIGSTPVGFGDAVAVVYVEGPIVIGQPASEFSASQAAYSERIVESLRAVQKDSSVKAVVLRIESPGGSVVASREIYDAILATRAKGKPVVASLGEIAASGGYYVAAAADKIYVHPGTLTGSIGVISILTNIEGLSEKVGVKVIVIKSGPHKDESWGFRELTAEERETWQKLIDEAYSDFVDVVAVGRHLDVAKVKTLADGRLYTGKQAKQAGLADELGNLEAAIEDAGKLGHISGTPRTIKFRHQRGFFESLVSSISPSLGVSDLAELFALHEWGRVMYLYIAP